MAAIDTTTTTTSNVTTSDPLALVLTTPDGVHGEKRFDVAKRSVDKFIRDISEHLGSTCGSDVTTTEETSPNSREVHYNMSSCTYIAKYSGKYKGCNSGHVTDIVLRVTWPKCAEPDMNTETFVYITFVDNNNMEHIVEVKSVCDADKENSCDGRRNRWVHGLPICLEICQFIELQR